VGTCRRDEKREIQVEVPQIQFERYADDKALKMIRDEIRSWKIHRKINLTLEDIKDTFNPILRGWFNYQYILYLINIF